MRPLLLLALTVAAFAGEAVDVVETGGNHVLGELVSEDGGSITVRGARNGTSWSRTLAKDRVSSVVYPDREYAQRAAAATEPADEARLACWCLEEGLRDKAQTHARHALDRDPEIDQARLVLARLGFVPDGKQWAPLDQWLASHQLAVVEGQVMAIADRDRVVAAQKQRDADRAAASPLAQAVKAADAAVARDQARHDQLMAEKAELAKRLATVQEAAKKEEQAQKQLEDAQKKAQQQAQRRNRQGGTTPTSSGTTTAEQQARKDAAAAHDAATTAQRDTASITKRQKDVDQQLQVADGALSRDKDTQAQAKSAADPALATAAASEKALKDLLASMAAPAGLPTEVLVAVHGSER